MAEEQKSLFRKKSQDYIDSPEKLDHYLHVTSPGVWILLVSVVVLLIGACVWGVMARLNTEVAAAIVVENGQAVCYVPEAAIDVAVKEKAAELDGEELSLKPDALEPETVTDSTNVYARIAGDLEVGDIYYEVPVTGANLADGIYSGTITTETISPWSLLFRY